MGLEQQIKSLDRSLRSGGAKPESEGLDPEDARILGSIDPPRLAAFSQYLGQKITERWWLERFPGTLRGIAHVFEGPEAPLTVAASQVLPSPFFERAIGEDRTGSALLGWLCDQGHRCPDWLRELAAYEYLLDTGLRLRADGEAPQADLERALLPEILDLLPPEQGPPGTIALRRRIVGACFDHAVDEIALALQSGLNLEGHDLEVDPRALLFIIEDEGFLELEARYPDADLLQLCAHPQKTEDLDALFEGLSLAPIIASFIDMGFLTRNG